MRGFASIPFVLLAGALTVVSMPAGASGATAPSKVVDGIVDVNVNLPYEDATGAGTGMVLASSGEVLTNNHVVRGATTVSVTDVGNHKTYAATVIGYDIDVDVAVLQLTGADHLRRVPLGNSRNLRVGDAVTAIGNAGGTGGTPSAVKGTVTALHRSITASDELGGSEQLSGLVETSAALQPGDSGGPLVSRAGKVVGMDTAGSSGISLSSGASSGFAIPIRQALRIARAIDEGHASAEVHIGPTPFLGVDVDPANSVDDGALASGVLVAGIVAGSPAQQAGLSPGDVITSLGGTSVTSSTTLTDLILDQSPGATVQLDWLSAFGTADSASVTLASGPPQ